LSTLALAMATISSEKHREQGELPAYWLEQLIEDERHSDIANVHDQLGRPAKSI